MKVKLNLYERVKAVDLLPLKGGLEKASIAADIKKKLEIKQEEIEKYALKTQQMGNGRVSTSWNEKGKEEVDFDFSKLEIQMLKDGVEDLNKKNEIPAEAAFVDLCLKIKDLEYKEKEK
jgi:hypothetical protein